MEKNHDDYIMQQAIATKEKRQGIMKSPLPFACKKCGVEKMPSEFTTNYIDSPLVGKYRYLHECKECKRKKMQAFRSGAQETLEGALELLYKQTKAAAKHGEIDCILLPWDLEQLWEKQEWKCYYTGYELKYDHLSFKEGQMDDEVIYQACVSRLDEKKGYTKMNTVLCCYLALMMKGKLSEQKFYEVCKDVVGRLGR